MFSFFKKGIKTKEIEKKQENKENILAEEKKVHSKYSDEDYEYFEEAKQRIVYFKQCYPDTDINLGLDEDEIKRITNKLEENNVNITNQIYNSMNKMNSSFRVDAYDAEKELLDGLYLLNNDSETFVNTDAEREIDNRLEMQKKFNSDFDNYYSNNSDYNCGTGYGHELYNPHTNDDYLGSSGIYNPHE